MWDRPFKTFCPSNYCIQDKTCVFVDDAADTLPVVLWNGDFSPMTLDEMRQGGYHHRRCARSCE